jgi:glycyl-tRNA synthetase alpha chain
LQDVDSIYDIVWARDPETGHATTYGDVRLAEELQLSVYSFEMADVDKTGKHFELYEAECKALLEKYEQLRAEVKIPTLPEERGRVGHPSADKRRFPFLRRTSFA